MKNRVIEVQNVQISISKQDLQEYICITDIAKAKSGESRSADVVKNWLRNRNTLEFLGTWEMMYNPEFKVVEFDHFKAEAENNSRQKEWDAKRFLSKNNYLIQTDAVKKYLLPNMNYRENLQWLAYAEEADVLNVALFGFTAKAWREANPELAKKNNVRDFATINELTVLSNLESHNAQMLREGRGKEERFKILQGIAKYQLHVLNAAEKIVMSESLPG